MLYQKLRLFAVLVLLIMLATGCGGSKGGAVSSSNLGDSSGNIVQGYTGGNPLIKSALSYDQRCYPVVEGFRIVPLADDFSQLAPQQSPYKFSVETEGEEAVLTIQVQDAKQVMLHVRYNPDEWVARSISIANPWVGAEDSFSASRDFAPGAIIISSVPAGDPDQFTADGELAEVHFRRSSLDARSVSDRYPPCPDLDEINILWHCDYSDILGYRNESTGTFTYAMDGGRRGPGSQRGG